MDIVREPEKFLSLSQEMVLLRRAFERSPTPALRASLAKLCLADDRFDDVSALLAGCGDLGFSERQILLQALLAMEAPEADRTVIELAEHGLALPLDKRQRAGLLADRAKAEIRGGLRAEARKSLDLALELDPANKDACKRMAAMDLRDDRAEALLGRIEELAAAGASHARLFAAKALAEARLGRYETARATVGLSQTLVQGRLPTPPGWDSLDIFNVALATELLQHPGLRYERYGSASNLTWRVENPAHPDAPLTRLLIDRIAAELAARVAAFGALPHPWALQAPAAAQLRVWCVITDGAGFEGWHVHQFGWLSGVYYVQIPEAIAQGKDEAGCLEMGLPPELIGAAASRGFESLMIRPQAGVMTTFPSHAYHRTHPYRGEGKRICVAYDLRPQ